MDATATSKIESWDNLSFVLAFNSIGWKPSNLLFNPIDAIIGDPLISSAFKGEQAAEAIAYLRDSDVHATGNLAVTATQAAQHHRDRRATRTSPTPRSTSPSARRAQAEGRSPAARSSRRTRSTRRRSAFIEFTGATQGTIEAADVLVAATDSASIASTSTVIQIAITKNDLTGLTRLVGQFFDDDYDYTTRSGSVTLKHGDRVRVAADYGLVKSDPGSIYVYNGADGALIDLGIGRLQGRPLPWTKVVLTTAAAARQLLSEHRQPLRLGRARDRDPDRPQRRARRGRSRGSTTRTSPPTASS